MPNNRVHSAISKSIAIASLAIVPFFPQSIFMTIGIALTIPIRLGKMSIYLNPDMDIKMNKGSQIAYALGLDAYQKNVRHRSGMHRDHFLGLWRNPWKILFFSHLPVIGTIPRSLLILFPMIVINLMVGIDPTPIPYVMLFSGMAISDIAHIVMDKIWTELSSG